MAILPAKTLQLIIDITEDYAYWQDLVNPGIWDGMPYQWKLVGTVPVPQIHSSPDTREPFVYNSLDIFVNDWISDNGGNSLQVVAVNSADGYNFEIIVEDVDRYNTFKDPSMSGFGGLSSQEAICFKLSEEGFPELGGITSGYFSNVAVDNIQSRFFGRNILSDYVRVYQTNNGFAIGDFIEIDPTNPGGFKLVSADKINMAVGIVNSINIPGSDYFTFKPLSSIIDNVQPPLVGNYGDIFYIDPNNPGKITNIRPETGIISPVYIRLENENRAVRLNAITDNNTETVVIEITVDVDGQTEFTMPTETYDVIEMSINGIENKNFTYDSVGKIVTFDPVATGYDVETSDEVFFTYLKQTY